MIILKLRGMKDSLSKKEIVVADYILEHRDQLKMMSIQTLSQLTKVSTTTVLRLCNKLGYSGFSEFKIALISSLKEETQEFIQEDITLNDSIEELTRKVYMMEKSSLDDTYSLVDIDMLKQAVHQIDKANKIVVFGVAGSGLIAKELEYELIKLKKNVSCHPDYHVQYNIVNTLDKQDLLVIISHSGETSECVELLKMAQQNHVPSIAITRMGSSKVSQLATIILNTPSNEDISRLIPIKSKISQLSVVNMLVTNLFIHSYDQWLFQYMQKRRTQEYYKKNHSVKK